MGLGQELQFLKWKAFQGDYPAARARMAAQLNEIGLALELPETVEELSAAHDEIFGQVYEHLTAERARLGGDVFGLTMFVFGYIPLEIVVSAAWKSENYEPLLWNLKGVLNDLDIEGEYETIRHAIDTETTWLAQKAEREGGDISVVDAAMAVQRLVGRIGSLWQAANRYRDTSVQFDQPPYHSVFISYSTADEAFCQKLYEALDQSGLRVWFAPHDVLPGRKIERQISAAIEQYDKLLLVLSEASMQSQWVETELYKAREREQATEAQILFPISLVPYDRIRAWKAFDADSGRDMAREVREYFIPDLSGWADDELFAREVERLTQALMVEEPAADPSLRQ
jgi:hypothetical protein